MLSLLSRQITPAINFSSHIAVTFSSPSCGPRVLRQQLNEYTGNETRKALRVTQVRGRRESHPSPCWTRARLQPTSREAESTPGSDQPRVTGTNHAGCGLGTQKLQAALHVRAASSPRGSYSPFRTHCERPFCKALSGCKASLLGLHLALVTSLCSTLPRRWLPPGRLGSVFLNPGPQLPGGAAAMWSLQVLHPEGASAPTVHPVRVWWFRAGISTRVFVKHVLHRGSLARALQQEVQRRLAWPALQWKKYMTITHDEKYGLGKRRFRDF